VRLKAPDSLDEEALIDYLREAHRIVLEKLARKARTELGIG
jgi:predicted DNA-binding protein (MmcQ/YjbR family)